MQRTGSTGFLAIAAVFWAGCAGAQESAVKSATSQPATAQMQKTTLASDVKPIPDGFFTLTPGLTVHDVAAAIAFYTDVFGAEKRFTLNSPDGAMIMHAELKIGDSILMLGPESPAMGSKSPKTLGSSPAALHYYVPDVDAAVKRATAAGARLVMPVADMFWGDRYGHIVDPFGHEWGIATHREELTEPEIAQRGAAWLKAMAAGDAANLKFEPGKPAASFKREGFHTLTPVIRVKDAGAAIEFYKAALGAEELNRMPMPDGRIMHAEIKIGDSVLMISDEMPEYGSKSPVTLGGTPFALMVYVDDVDTAFALAVKAGAKAKQPVMDQFWGDRYGEIEDPSGHRWGLATHKENLTPDQISERMKKQYAGPQGEHKPGEHQK